MYVRDIMIYFSELHNTSHFNYQAVEKEFVYIILVSIWRNFLSRAIASYFRWNYYSHLDLAHMLLVSRLLLIRVFLVVFNVSPILLARCNTTYEKEWKTFTYIYIYAEVLGNFIVINWMWSSFQHPLRLIHFINFNL